jgi:hypothetical protein
MKALTSAACEVISRNQLVVMLVRGIAGLGLMAWSFNYLVAIPMLGFSMLGISILLLKGCPACWGIHMINILRGATKTKALIQHEKNDDSEKLVKRNYQPKDLSEHLFPPEDVARFRSVKVPATELLIVTPKESHV